MNQSLFPRAFAVALLMAGAGALVMALRITTLDEAGSTRAQALIALMATGSFLAGLAGAFACGLLMRWLPRLAAGMITVILAAPAFALGFAGSFALYNAYWVSEFDSETFSGHWFRELIYTPASSFGIFLQTGVKYVLPWPTPLLGLIFLILCAVLFLRK